MLKALPFARFALDGELLIETGGRLRFDALQMRLHPAESRIRKLAAGTPARLMAFDMLLAPDGEVLANRPLAPSVAWRSSASSRKPARATGFASRPRHETSRRRKAGSRATPARTALSPSGSTAPTNTASAP